MNLLLEYQNKFLNFLKKLKNDKIIYFPDSIKELTVELTPKNKNADISSNMAMILVKFNDKTSIEIANILKKNISENFQEFEKIEVMSKKVIYLKQLNIALIMLITLKVFIRESSQQLC